MYFLKDDVEKLSGGREKSLIFQITFQVPQRNYDLKSRFAYLVFPLLPIFPASFTHQKGLQYRK